MKLKHVYSGWVKDEVILLAIFWATLGLYLAFLLYLSLAIESNPSFAAIYHDCLSTDQESGSESGWSVSNAITFLTLVPMIFLSIGMDLVCLWKVQRERTILEANKKDQFKLGQLKEPEANQPEVIINVNELGPERPEPCPEQGSAEATEGNGLEKALNIVGQMSLMAPENQPDRNQVIPVEKADSLKTTYF